MTLSPTLLLILTTLARYVLGGVFLFAALSKVMNPSAFALDVSHYRLLPDALIHPVALWLPALELVAGVLVVAGPFKGEAALWIGLMLVGFLGGEVQALIRGLDISCGCFGTGSGKIDALSLLRNAGLLVLSIWIVFDEGLRRRVKSSAAP